MALRGCGKGCFYAVAHGKKGVKLLTVRAAAKGWRGGRETLRVMWPVQPDPALAGPSRTAPSRKAAWSRRVLPLLALLVVLVTALGALCRCVPGHDVRAAFVPTPSLTAGFRTADGDVRDRARACVLSTRDDRCAGHSAVNTPVTGPGPHPCPQCPPSCGVAWPAVVTAAFSGYAAPPRPPDPHVLQVLRT